MTDCLKCIYGHKTIRQIYDGEKAVCKEMTVCDINLRTTRPECPLYDDGKEVRE